jgi:hypothetical protein
MDFDIYKLDNIDPNSEEANKVAEKYQNALVEKFADSPEGEERLKADPEMGFWTGQLIYFGYSYNGATVPAMTVGDVEEIVTELLPRKISMSSPDDADKVVPELVAFWEYLKREYNLSNAKSVLRFLREIEPGFKKMMNDSSKFGMAKSLMMMGQSAGFDMTKKEDSDAFISMYNANLPAEREEQQNPPMSSPDYFTPNNSKSQNKKAKKKKRKIASVSRKKMRKKRK